MYYIIYGIFIEYIYFIEREFSYFFKAVIGIVALEKESYHQDNISQQNKRMCYGLIFHINQKVHRTY